MATTRPNGQTPPSLVNHEVTPQSVRIAVICFFESFRYRF